MTFYRIVLDSRSALNAEDGSATDLTFFVDLPQLVEGDHMLAAESFTCAQYGVDQNVVITCPDILQANSYSTATKGPTQDLLYIPYNGSGTFFERVTSDTLGIPLQSVLDLRSKRIRIVIRGVDGSPLNLNEHWTMTLVVWPTPKSHPTKQAKE